MLFDDSVSGRVSRPGLVLASLLGLAVLPGWAFSQEEPPAGVPSAGASPSTDAAAAAPPPVAPAATLAPTAGSATPATTAAPTPDAPSAEPTTGAARTQPNSGAQAIPNGRQLLFDDGKVVVLRATDDGRGVIVQLFEKGRHQGTYALSNLLPLPTAGGTASGANAAYDTLSPVPAVSSEVRPYPSPYRSEPASTTAPGYEVPPATAQPSPLGAANRSSAELRLLENALELATLEIEEKEIALEQGREERARWEARLKAGTVSEANPPRDVRLLEIDLRKAKLRAEQARIQLDATRGAGEAPGPLPTFPNAS